MRCNKVVALCVITLIVLSAAPVYATNYTIPEKTEIILRLLTTLKSGKSKKGQIVELQVDKAVKGYDKTILIEDGADAYGTVTESKRNGMFGVAGKLDFTIDYVEAADGTHIPVRATIENQAANCTGGAVVGFLCVSVLSGLFRGENVKVESGTMFKAYVDKDTKVNIIKEGEQYKHIKTDNLTGAVTMDPQSLYMDINGARFMFDKADLGNLQNLFATGIEGYDHAVANKANIVNKLVGRIGDNFKLYLWSMNNGSNAFLNIKTGMGEMKLTREDAVAISTAINSIK